MLTVSMPDVSYISDSAGNTTAAIIPIRMWREIEREIASEQETAYLSQNTTMKQRILESLQEKETISFEETCAKLGIQPEGCRFMRQEAIEVFARQVQTKE